MPNFVRLLIFLLFLSNLGSAQTPPEFSAGFSTVHLIDSSRIYKSETPDSHPLHYRPLDLDVWYPSERSQSGSALLFEDLFRLHEARADTYQEETDYKGFSEELIMYLAAGFGLEPMDGKRLLKKPTQSYRDATVLEGRFPLILYMAGYNGMGWESYRLLEALAERGFVVVSIASVGRYPGDMTNSLENTMEQVLDAEYALQYLETTETFPVDMSKKGIVGLSWGGMSGILLLDRQPDFQAMVSLDGSDTFYYGETAQDDQDLSEIFAAGVLHPKQTTAAFFHLEAGDRLEGFIPTGVYRYYEQVNGPIRYARFLRSRHEDFSSLGWALAASEESTVRYENIVRATSLFLEKHLKAKPGFDAYYDRLLNQPGITQAPVEFERPGEQEVLISGRVSDKTTREGLPYVNIGVVGKAKGGVSDPKGEFQLELNESHVSDTLRFSMLGFEDRAIPVKDLVTPEGRVEIFLTEAVSELDEVILTARQWKRKTLGNKTESTFIGHLFYADQKGKEMGIRMNVGKKPLWVENFSFFVSHNRFEAKTVFRLNMYLLEKGKPTRNILDSNIILSVAPGQTGRIAVDLRPYNIVLTQDVLVTLEWIDSEGKINPTDALSISLGLIAGGMYERSAKVMEMKKVFRGMGLGFTMDVRY